MNILHYQGWLRINIFNLLGNFDGHYVVYLNVNTKQYYFRKFGDYCNLVSYNPVDCPYKKLAPEEAAIINEVIEKRLTRDTDMIHDISDSLWDNIYCDVRAVIESFGPKDHQYLNTYTSTVPDLTEVPL